MRLRSLVVAGLLGLLLALGFIWWTRPQQNEGAPQLSLAPPSTENSFARASQARPIILPEDHGPHPNFQTEWWYFTGNLQTAEGRRFGYQLTFFRRGLDSSPPKRTSEFAASQVYFAHLALSDIEGSQHREWERFSRGALGLAGAESPPFRVWLEDWRVEATDEEGSRLRLRAAANDLEIDLDLVADKPLVLHGESGLSLKSREPGNASYYVSYTDLSTGGLIQVGGEAYSVTGKSWFDHEWSTSALGEGAVGWDWFSLQFESGRELMYFQIRKVDGTIEPVSSGTLIEADGETRFLKGDEVLLEPAGTWTSPQSGASYPIAWSLRLPEEELEIRVEALLADQEMNLSFTYWEGAVRFEGEWEGQPVAGLGFLEMTGYAESMQDTF